MMWSDPHYFNPDRFMPGGEYDNFPDDLRTYMFVPFTQGPRNCLGQHMALLEARVLLGRTLQMFEIEPVAKGELDILWEIIPITPRNGLEVRVTAR